MNLQSILEELDLQVISKGEPLDRNCAGCYVSDLLSDVMGHAKEGEIWMTIQTHSNVVAVALLLNLAAILFTSGVKPEPDTVEKAEEEGVLLLSTKMSTFETAGRLYQLLTTEKP